MPPVEDINAQTRAAVLVCLKRDLPGATRALLEELRDRRAPLKGRTALLKVLLDLVAKDSRP